ncbi:MAG: cytoplasmic protein [Deltaproteobacteria bacterium]|nr:cytoplasmic protein [Deltaproteobacteria bacterium]
MPSNDQQHEIDFTVDRNNLYREESFTDIKVAAIRRLTPIKPDGSDDESRNPIYMAQTQLMSPSGPVVLQSILDAGTLEQAMDKFPKAMQKEMGKVMEKNKKEQGKVK